LNVRHCGPSTEPDRSIPGLRYTLFRPRQEILLQTLRFGVECLVGLPAPASLPRGTLLAPPTMSFRVAGH
jgi:hypothetical protein